MKANYKHIDDYLEQADDIKSADFAALRAQAANDLKTFGFPALKTESWKYTSAKSLLNTVYEPANSIELGADKITPYLLADAFCLVIVNGIVSDSLSNIDSKHLTMTSLKTPGQQVSTALTGFTALNSLLFQQGYHLEISGILEKPLHILHVSSELSDDVVMYHRQQITLADDAGADVIEQFVSLDDAAYWQNSVSEVVVGAKAKFNYYKLVQEACAAKHTAYLSASLGESGNFNSFNLDLSGQLIRNDLRVLLQADKATCDLQGLYLARDKQHVDNHTIIEHLHPYTYSNEYYKGIVADKAHAVFNGRVLVAKDAQKVDSAQKNANLLLSADCEIDTKPELEIYADDVKCAHGATVGQLDEKAVFYLQSRGVDKIMAEKLLTHGFAYEVVEAINNRNIRDFFTQHLASWFVNDVELQELML